MAEKERKMAKKRVNWPLPHVKIAQVPTPAGDSCLFFNWPDGSQIVRQRVPARHGRKRQLWRQGRERNWPESGQMWPKVASNEAESTLASAGEAVRRWARGNVLFLPDGPFELNGRYGQVVRHGGYLPGTSLVVHPKSPPGRTQHAVPRYPVVRQGGTWGAVSTLWPGSTGWGSSG